MAELNGMGCPACGAPLAQVPGLCPECGAFWSSPEDVVARLGEGERTASQDPEGGPHDVPRTPGNQGPPAGMLPCGHPGTPGEPCPWCGSVSEEPRGGACLAVGGERLGLPDGVEVVLGRESPWAQVAGLFSRLRQEDGAIGEAARGVSRRHAAVTVTGGRVRVADMGSLNGTWIDRRELGAAPVTRDLPLSLQLGVPGMGLVVEILEDEPGSGRADGTGTTRWTGERRD